MVDSQNAVQISSNDVVALNTDVDNFTIGSSRIIEITQDNYDDYFDLMTGKILDGADISKGDTLKIGNISNRAFVIDRQLTLLPISENDEISNGFIHLVKGSDGSTVSNLTINNTKGTLTIKGVTVGQLHGIWITNSNNNLISYNTIRLANTAGVYAMPMGWSSNNRIINNDMKTYVTSVIIMGECHYNLISNNELEVLSYSDLSVTNLIYFNPFGHADFTGSSLCKGNIISSNYLKGFCTGAMSIILQMEYANHDGTIVANNTVIKGSFGINLKGNNVSVYGNTVQGSEIGISVSGSSFDIYNNNVSGSNQNLGIRATSENSQAYVFDNNVDYSDVSCGISIGQNVKVFNNNVTINGYGVGIGINGNNSEIYSNNIKNKHDSGVSILGSYNKVDNNIITTKSIGVSIPGSLSKNQRYYNNSITSNRITSDNHAISIVGLVYNSIIMDNVIETNSSLGVNIDITDRLSNTESDNMVNGVILNSTAIVVCDDNFYQYFDDEGYLTYQFDENKTKIIFFTFLTNKNIIFDDKINVISNKMNNLLFNVTITFEGDAEGSLIRDFNFVNYDREAIIVDGVDDVSVSGNNITSIFRNGGSTSSSILIKNICKDIVISNNNIYVNSKLSYAYAIDAPAINPDNGRYNRILSKRLSVKDNTIIMICDGVGEAIYTDAFVESDFINNRINIISDGCGYGIAFANMIGRLYGLNVTCNEIIIHSKEMAYLVELHMVDNATISDNALYSESLGSYGIGIYRSNNISIENNDISLFGGDVDGLDYVPDALGKGNSAIGVIRNCTNVSIGSNLIYANVTAPISLVNVTNPEEIAVCSNSYVIDDDNYDVYFTQEGILKTEIIEAYNNLLLKNLTKNQIMQINVPLNIYSYDKEIPITVSLRLVDTSDLLIEGIYFVNSTIMLDNTSNTIIKDSIFKTSNSNILLIENGENNLLDNNSFYANSGDIDVIILKNTQSNNISNNKFEISADNAKIISNLASNYNLIDNNVMSAQADNLVFVLSNGAEHENLTNNVIMGNATSIFGYFASNVSFGFVELNDIEINGFSNTTNQSAIYYCGLSAYNNVTGNNIISYSLNHDDYAVIIASSKNQSNYIIKNYLVSSNGIKRANDAVLAPFDFVDKNTPLDIYVSVNGSDEDGDGSVSNPYASISKAITSSLNHSVIYVGDGYYNESGITVDKDLSLIAINPNKVIIDAQSNQLFRITSGGSLLVDSFIIKNAHDEMGGSVFINDGELYIYNSIISNCSSYHDNSHPVFDRDVVYESDGEINSGHTQNYINTGKGGVILNNGGLYISSSVFYDNFGHWGGVIADYGQTTINSSSFFDNRGVHGGVIYSDSKSQLSIVNSQFKGNIAVTSLDYCSLRIATSSWSIEDGNHYTYYSDCGVPIGMGGVVYSENTDLYLFNSSFMDNSARLGGVIATQCDSFSSYSTFESNVDLIIDNCYFLNNKVNDTRYISGSVVDLDNFNYYSGYNGAVVYGTYKKLHITDSKFYSNQAVDNGGALYAKSDEGLILDSIFENNVAGISGGALDISKNFIIMRTIISNNSASYGGAIEYSSYTYYGHIQDNLNIYNSTISHNRALNVGGAINIGASNITIHDSNIVDNLAPAYETIHSSGGSYAIDMRYNYWGTTKSGYEGPDDSVWRLSNNLFKPWYREWVHWEPKNIEIDPVSPVDVDVDDNEDSSGNPGTVPIVNPSQTGSSTSTGVNIGGNGDNDGKKEGNGIYSGDGDGNNLGPGDGDGNGGSLISLPGHKDYDGQAIRGQYNANSKVHGTVNSDSLSKSNSSHYNADLASVGMTDNAASSSSSSNGGDSGDSSSLSESSVSKSYEIEEKIDELLNNDNPIISYVLIGIVIILLIIGFKRKYGEDNK